jgi:hypothetical protein
MLSMLFPPPPPPSHLLPFRVTYASVFVELSFLTSSKFKGLKSISIWNSLLQWQSFAQGAQTHLHNGWHVVKKGFKVTMERKGKERMCNFAHKTHGESPTYLIFKCKGQPPWLGLYQNKGHRVSHDDDGLAIYILKKYLKKAKQEIRKLKIFHHAKIYNLQ